MDILLIDRLAARRDALGIALSNDGHNLLLASDRTSGARIVERYRDIDLIMLDPFADGLPAPKFLATVCQTAPKAKIALIDSDYMKRSRNHIEAAHESLLKARRQLARSMEALARARQLLDRPRQ